MADLDPPTLILGSASPRRAALLTALGLPFVVEPGHVDEERLVVAGDTAGSAARRVAAAKFAASGARATEGGAERQLLLTADTVVSCGGTIMGKPADRDHLRAMLHSMSGRAVEIATAVCAGPPGGVPRSMVVTTVVDLRGLDETEITRYIASGAGDDKAGGLALQDTAAPFIASMQGCWSNVVGLPLCAVAALLDLPPRGVRRSERCSAHGVLRRPSIEPPDEAHSIRLNIGASWQVKADVRPATGTVVGTHGAAMPFDDLLHDRQTQT